MLTRNLTSLLSDERESAQTAYRARRAGLEAAEFKASSEEAQVVRMSEQISALDDALLLAAQQGRRLGVFSIDDDAAAELSTDAEVAIIAPTAPAALQAQTTRSSIGLTDAAIDELARPQPASLAALKIDDDDI